MEDTFAKERDKEPEGVSGEEGCSRDHRKSGGSSVITGCLPCHRNRSWRVISGDNSHYEQERSFKFFKEEVKVSQEPAGSRLPSARNAPHAEGVPLGDAGSEPLRGCLAACLSRMNP